MPANRSVYLFAAGLMLCGWFMAWFPLYAVSAYSSPVSYRQPDGSTVTLHLRGDERVRRAETVDGYTCLLNDLGFYEYAERVDSTTIVRSGLQARDIPERTTEEQRWLQGKEKHLFHKDVKSINRLLPDGTSDVSLRASQAPPSQTKILRIPVILVGFQDKPFTHTNTAFFNLFNQVGYNVGNATGSVRDYYLASSTGKLDINFEVFGPYTLPNNVSYYSSLTEVSPKEMVREAIDRAAADGCDFSRYDADRNVIVDDVHLVFAGYDQAAGATAGSSFWSHAAGLDPTIQLNGKTIAYYTCSSELRYTVDTLIAPIGIAAHELGHILGLPDLYDTDYDISGQSVDIGRWDIMAAGSWNNGGDTPPLHSAWCRKELGWVTPTTLSGTNVSITLPNPGTKAVSYSINTKTAGEYFLLENRQQQGWDRYLPASGLLIYHVDDNYIQDSENCLNCDPAHRGLYVKQAGGPATSDNPLQQNDPYPFKNNNRFTDTSIPNALSWAGQPSAQPLVNISHNTTDKTVSFLYQPTDRWIVSAEPSSSVLGYVENAVFYYKAGETATVKAVNTDPHYPFTGWSREGKVVSTDNPYTFTVSQDTHLTAVFSNPYASTQLFKEDFEGDVSAWVLDNDTLYNRWHIGTATACNGERSAYISDDQGVSNVYHSDDHYPTYPYQNNQVHLYKDLAFPDTTAHFFLLFNWRGMGQASTLSDLFHINHDYLSVYLADTNQTPQAGSAFKKGSLIGLYSLQADWQQASIELPGSLCAGKTKRLVFSWSDNGYGDYQPPAAIDNIILQAYHKAPYLQAPFLEDFETGREGWITPGIDENPNAFALGSVPTTNGSNALFLSDDQGVTNHYSDLQLANRLYPYYLYTQVAFPSDMANYHLTFDWKAGIATPEDRAYLSVWLTDAYVNYVPTDGRNLTMELDADNAQTYVKFLGRFDGTSNWEHADLPLFIEHAGTLRRLIFAWFDQEGSTLTEAVQPPLAIDNIAIGPTTQTINPSTRQQPLVIYPNPATERVVIHTAGGDRLDIINLLGQVVYTQQHPDSQTALNLLGWSKGLYLVRLRHPLGISLQHLLIQ